MLDFIMGQNQNKNTKNQTRNVENINVYNETNVNVSNIKKTHIHNIEEQELIQVYTFFFYFSSLAIFDLTSFFFQKWGESLTFDQITKSLNGKKVEVRSF